jgi:(p)ppGpp synthase/HD superfamily hydrolase
MYSPRIELAIIRVLESHGLRERKAGEGFEASHVISVALIVRDFGFDEDTIVAAVLHDTLEDTALDAAIIRRDFGERVLAIVQDVTEPPKLQPWAVRKAAYIDRLRRSPLDEARAVASADKIHNLSRMIDGSRRDADYWRLFNAGLDDIAKYQQDVFHALSGAWRHPILDRHGQLLREFLAAV